MNKTHLAKDVLIIDFETSSINTKICSPLQIGAILLDKHSLSIVSEYNSYIIPCTPDWSSTSEDVHKLKYDLLMKVGKRVDIVIQELLNAFNFNDIILASWNAFDIIILERFLDLRKYNMYRFIELWSYTLPFIQINNIVVKDETHHKLDTLVAYFNLQNNNRHDALNDARIEAQIFIAVTRAYATYSSSLKS